MLTENTISPDFPYESRYVEVLGERLHYIEQGQGEPVLFLHGNPTHVYLWRNVIPHLSPRARCIAFDLVGMGRSAHPDIEYRLADHIPYVDGFIQALKLKNVLLVLHDWGCALGFDYARRHESNVRGLAYMEPVLEPIPDWEAFPESWRDTFKAFRTPDVGWDLIVNQNVFVEKIIPGAVVRTMGEAEMAHYRAPYADHVHRKALWRWPNEIPIGGEPPDATAIVAANHRWLATTPLPQLLLHANPGGLVSAQQIAWCKKHFRNFTEESIGPGVHYLQEDNPHGIGRAIARWAGLG